MTVREYEVSNLNCADCGNKIEAGIQALSNVNRANLDFMAKKLTVEYRETVDNHLIMLNNVAASIDPAVEISEAGELSRKKQALYAWLPLAAGLAVIIASQFLPLPWKSWLGLAAYLLVGYRVLQGAAHSIVKKQVFSEKLLMSLATIGAVILGEFPEAVAVMLLYQIGQWLEDRAVEHSRRSVRGLLSLKPELAHLKRYRLAT
jgi:Cd2+/Zn2+-exporting ATPase